MRKIILIFNVLLVMLILSGNALCGKYHSPSNNSFPEVKFESFRRPLGVKVDSEKQMVKIFCDDIINHDINEKSGDLQIAVYLTTTKYLGGTIDGYEIATQDCGQLFAGEMYKINELTLNYEKNPAPGSYYVTLILEQYDNDNFYIVDYLGENEKIIIPEKGASDLDIVLAILGGLAGQEPQSGIDNDESGSNNGGDYSKSSSRQKLENQLNHAESQLAKDQAFLERQKDRYYDQKRRGKDASAELMAIHATERLIRSDENLISSIKHRLSELN